MKRIITKLIIALSYLCIKNSDLIYFDGVRVTGVRHH